MAGRLSGKAAIVTGSGRGIGRAIARTFAAEGASVLTVDKDEAAAARTAEEIGRAGSAAAPFRADVSVQEDVEAMARAAVDRFGRIDVLAQNAGIYPLATIEQMSSEQWDLVLNVNLRSLFFAVKACLPHMQRQRSGRIVVTSSITGPKVAIAALTHYAASKAGVNGFIRAAALELAPHNITINGVEPGTVLTEGLREMNAPQVLEDLAQAIPLKRLADPRDIANALLFFASDEASYITGQTLVVDGGQILPELKL